MSPHEASAPSYDDLRDALFDLPTPDYGNSSRTLETMATCAERAANRAEANGREPSKLYSEAEELMRQSLIMGYVEQRIPLDSVLGESELRRVIEDVKQQEDARRILEAEEQRIRNRRAEKRAKCDRFLGRSAGSSVISSELPTTVESTYGQEPSIPDIRAAARRAADDMAAARAMSEDLGLTAEDDKNGDKITYKGFLKP